MDLKKYKVNPECMGGAMVTKSLLEGTSELKWFYRENPVDQQDNGWRAIGDTDTQEYIDEPSNSVIVDFNSLIQIEPAVLSICHLPVGTELELKRVGKELHFIDLKTGNIIP